MKTAKLSTFITLVLAILVMLEVTSCMPSAELKAKRDRDARKAVQMNKLLGRGVNFGNALDAPSEGEWGVVLKDEYFELAKQAGFDSVRLPVRWSAHSLDKPPYTIDPNFMKRVDWAVNNAISRKLPVILNVHHFMEAYSDPNGQKEKFLALWEQIAEHYKGYPDILVFELMNEPKRKLTDEIWNVYLRESLAIVRKSNPNRTIIIGPGDNNIIEHLKTLEIPEGDRNIIVTIHYYEPIEFTHQGAAWITRGDPNTWMGTKWTGSDANQQAVVKAFDIAAAWAKANNRPINLGEFGSYEKADMESRARWTKFVADTAIKRGMSFDYWEFCANEFGLYDRQTKSFRKLLLDAVIPPKQ
ncbi:MAG: glycoside hydrolase family 5 protein [Sedimentisphaerales bacterium]|jgi:endoglucanase